MVVEVRMINGLVEDSNKRFVNEEVVVVWNVWVYSIAGLLGGEVIIIFFFYLDRNRLLREFR